jgi:chromosome condensin MukBEF ATPase and DNA-binding subunit MukB
MPESLSIEEALRRLEAALSKVEDALDHQVEQGVRVTGLEGELHRLGRDRSRLAQALDASEARAARLEDAGAQASEGLDRALETIRDVLARHGG